MLCHMREEIETNSTFGATRMDPQGSEHRRCYCVHALARDSGISKLELSKTSFWTPFWTTFLLFSVRQLKKSGSKVFFSNKIDFWTIFFSYLTENSKKVERFFLARFSKSQLFDHFLEDPIPGNAKTIFFIFAKK